MAFSILDTLLVVAVAANGLLAGLFFSFTCAIAPAFRRVDDRVYVQAFRAINAAILNGWFLFVFFAAPLAAVVGAVLGLGHETSLPWLIAGAVCSALTFGITAAANVPLNRGLDQAPVGTEAQSRVARQRFENRWNLWNLARTITSSGALTLLAIAVTL
ncbi:anthrone oxygenase family protein [Sinosporangium siamense]|uniref:anthrone oxygenase family protein n=1 Tax=Sinosporangium siamense TaxID=1367973 RepID=UPI001EF2DD05|nr:anthrone oxygenase family protein [Sinosporangium siamense]